MEFIELIIRFEALTKSFELLREENLALKKENRSLKEELAKYQTPKNSSNSSIPPSQDQNRPQRNQSLREPSGNKPGGQKGREGKTLEMTTTPDKIVELKPAYCTNCGDSLAGLLSIQEQIRQQIDIPPIQAIITEYQTFSRQCTCGCKNTSIFPEGVNASVSYGPRIEGLTGYFHARHYLPFGRLEELFNDVFNVNISEGGIHCLLNRFAEKTTPVYETIKNGVAHSSVVGSDETGGKVNGKKNWFWTWQTPKLTFIAHSENRGGDTIKTHFPNGFPQSALVHDGWKPQLNTKAKHHQSCLAHLQRILKYLNQKYPDNEWGKKFIQLLYDALNLKKEMTSEDYHKDFQPKNRIIKRFKKLLVSPPKAAYEELCTFYRRMNREQNYLFTFLEIPDVPPDNNASERAIRNVKVKQKISGQFKVAKAAQNFAKIRSVIDTTIKKGLNVVETLSNIAQSEIRIRTC